MRGSVRIGTVIAWSVGILGGLVVVGWLAGVAWIPRPVASAPAMAPGTAVALLLCAAAVALQTRAPRWRGCALGVVVAVVGAVFLVERALGGELDLAALLPPDVPHRPAFETALGLALLGVALALLDVRPRLAQLLTIAAAATATLVLLGYLFGLGYVGLDESPIGMAPHTAIALLALAVATIAIRPRVGLTAVLASRRIGGVTARRLLVVAAITLPVVGAVSTHLQHAGVFPVPGATVIASTASLFVIFGAILVIATRLERADGIRRATEDSLRDALDREAVQRALLESILAQLPEPVLVIDAKGTLLHENESARAFRNAEADSASGGKAPFVLKRPTGEPLSIPELPLARAAFGGETIKGHEMLVEVTGGQQIPIVASATPVWHDGAIVAGVALFRDMRMQKELERMREEWSSVIAHDLRQPVNGIRLAAELLLHGAKDAKQVQWAGRIRDDAVRLNQMIQDLLDASRLEARRLSIERRTESLDDLLEVVLGRLPEVARRVDVAVAPDARWVLVDGARMIQVLGNLLSNAGKYGDASWPIQVAAVADGDAAHVTVTNHGTGIPADELPRLFDRFMRTRSARSSRVEGTGLGLYICKGLVEAHGGRIWVESTPGETTTFHVTLPLAPTANPARFPAPTDVASPA